MYTGEWITKVDLGTYRNMRPSEILNEAKKIIKQWASDNQNIKNVEILTNAVLVGNSSSHHRVLSITTTTDRWYLYKMSVRVVAETEEDYRNSYRGLPYNTAGFIMLDKIYASGISSSKSEIIYSNK